MSALETQVAGSHYKDKAIQPVEYIHANGLGFLEGCIVKRITRWRDKDGVRDLQKIKHEVDLLIELEGRKISERQVAGEIAAATAERMMQEERTQQAREWLDNGNARAGKPLGLHIDLSNPVRWPFPSACDKPSCVLCWGDIKCHGNCA